MRSLAITAALIAIAGLCTSAVRAQSGDREGPAAQADEPPQRPEPKQGPRRSPDDVSYLRKRGDDPGDGLLGWSLVGMIIPDWFSYKHSLEEATRFDFGMAYTGLYQKATDSLTDIDSAGSGDFDLFGEWNLLGDKPGNRGLLGFALEDRHKYGEIPPSQLGQEIGSAWPTTRAFDTHDFALVQLYWDQHLLDDRLEFRIGKVDHNTIWDQYTLRSETVAFQNLMFSGNVSLKPPTAFGGLVSWRPTEATYLMGGIADANGTRGVFAPGTFFSEHEYYYFAEAGYSPRLGPYEVAYLHSTFWYVDPRTEAGTDSGYGVALTAQYTLDDLIPFLRYAWSDAEYGTVYARQNVNAGFGIMRPFGRADDAFGFGVGAGEEVLGSSWQVNTEIFYRLQLTDYVQVTPSVQGIFNPLDNPDSDAIAVFGIRFRFNM